MHIHDLAYEIVKQNIHFRYNDVEVILFRDSRNRNIELSMTEAISYLNIDADVWLTEHGLRDAWIDVVLDGEVG